MLSFADDPRVRPPLSPIPGGGGSGRDTPMFLDDPAVLTPQAGSLLTSGTTLVASSIVTAVDDFDAGTRFAKRLALWLPQTTTTALVGEHYEDVTLGYEGTLNAAITGITTDASGFVDGAFRPAATGNATHTGSSIQQLRRASSFARLRGGASGGTTLTMGGGGGSGSTTALHAAPVDVLMSASAPITSLVDESTLLLSPEELWHDAVAMRAIALWQVGRMRDAVAIMRDACRELNLDFSQSYSQHPKSIAMAIATGAYHAGSTTTTMSGSGGKSAVNTFYMRQQSTAAEGGHFSFATRGTEGRRATFGSLRLSRQVSQEFSSDNSHNNTQGIETLSRDASMSYGRMPTHLSDGSTPDAIGNASKIVSLHDLTIAQIHALVVMLYVRFDGMYFVADDDDDDDSNDSHRGGAAATSFSASDDATEHGRHRDHGGGLSTSILSLDSARQLAAELYGFVSSLAVPPLLDSANAAQTTAASGSTGGAPQSPAAILATSLGAALLPRLVQLAGYVHAKLLAHIARPKDAMAIMESLLKQHALSKTTWQNGRRRQQLIAAGAPDSPLLPPPPTAQSFVAAPPAASSDRFSWLQRYQEAELLVQAAEVAIHPEGTLLLTMMWSSTPGIADAAVNGQLSSSSTTATSQTAAPSGATPVGSSLLFAGGQEGGSSMLQRHRHAIIQKQRLNDAVAILDALATSLQPAAAPAAAVEAAAMSDSDVASPSPPPRRTASPGPTSAQHPLRLWAEAVALRALIDSVFIAANSIVPWLANGASLYRSFNASAFQSSTSSHLNQLLEVQTQPTSVAILSRAVSALDRAVATLQTHGLSSAGGGMSYAETFASLVRGLLRLHLALVADPLLTVSLGALMAGFSVYGNVGGPTSTALQPQQQLSQPGHGAHHQSAAGWAPLGCSVVLVDARPVCGESPSAGGGGGGGNADPFSVPPPLPHSAGGKAHRSGTGAVVRRRRSIPGSADRASGGGAPAVGVGDEPPVVAYAMKLAMRPYHSPSHNNMSTNQAGNVALSSIPSVTLYPSASVTLVQQAQHAPSSLPAAVTHAMSTAYRCLAASARVAGEDEVAAWRSDSETKNTAPAAPVRGGRPAQTQGALLPSSQTGVLQDPGGKGDAAVPSRRSGSASSTVLPCGRDALGVAFLNCLVPFQSLVSAHRGGGASAAATTTSTTLAASGSLVAATRGGPPAATSSSSSGHGGLETNWAAIGSVIPNHAFNSTLLAASTVIAAVATTASRTTLRASSVSPSSAHHASSSLSRSSTGAAAGNAASATTYHATEAAQLRLLCTLWGAVATTAATSASSSSSQASSSHAGAGGSTSLPLTSLCHVVFLLRIATQRYRDLFPYRAPAQLKAVSIIHGMESTAKLLSKTAAAVAPNHNAAAASANLVHLVWAAFADANGTLQRVVQREWDKFAEWRKQHVHLASFEDAQRRAGEQQAAESRLRSLLDQVDFYHRGQQWSKVIALLTASLREFQSVVGSAPAITDVSNHKDGGGGGAAGGGVDTIRSRLIAALRKAKDSVFGFATLSAELAALEQLAEDTLTNNGKAASIASSSSAFETSVAGPFVPSPGMSPRTGPFSPPTNVGAGTVARSRN